ncbi:MAG: type VII secretion target, partial [Dehalococcoidia bacterium]
MGFFRVDPHHLEALAHRLDDGVSHLQAAARELARMGPSGLGTESLDAACHELQQEWDGGTERIAALSAELAEGLRDTARTYRASD